VDIKEQNYIRLNLADKAKFLEDQRINYETYLESSLEAYNAGSGNSGVGGSGSGGGSNSNSSSAKKPGGLMKRISDKVLRRTSPTKGGAEAAAGDEDNDDDDEFVATETVKYPPAKLRQKGVLLRHSEDPKPVSFEFLTSAERPGSIRMVCRYAVSIDEKTMVLQDLLHMQYNGVKRKDLLPNCEFDITLLIALLNRKLFGKG
jgi:hypothetical protein